MPDPHEIAREAQERLDAAGLTPDRLRQIDAASKQVREIIEGLESKGLTLEQIAALTEDREPLAPVSATDEGPTRSELSARVDELEARVSRLEGRAD